MEITAPHRIQPSTRGATVSTRHSNGEISPRRRSSFECERVYVQSMDDWSDRVDRTLEMGSIEVRRVGHGSRIYWAARPREKTVRCGSEKRAREYVKRAIARRRGHRYEELPETVLIRRRPVQRRVEPAAFLPLSCLSISSARPRKPRGWATVAGTRC
jgi:hypothetical protein